MSSPLSVTVIPGFLPADDVPVSNADLRAIANPTVSLAGSAGSAIIADGSITPAKLATSVAGAGLTGGGGAALSVVPDNITIDINPSTQAVEIMDGGVTLGKTNLPFQGASAYCRGIPGLLPEPQAGDQGKYLRGDGKWIDALAAATAAAQAGTQFQIFAAYAFC